MANYEWMLFLALAATVVGIAYFTNRYSWRKCLSLRLEGIRVNRLTKQLLLDLQQHRGMVNAFLSGDNSFKVKIEQKQTAIGKDIAALDAFHGQGLMTEKRWEGIRNDWQALRTEALRCPLRTASAAIANLSEPYSIRWGMSPSAVKSSTCAPLIVPWWMLFGASSLPLRRAWVKRGEWAPAWRQKAIVPALPASGCAS